MASQEERDRIMAEYMASVQDDDDDDDDEAEFQPGMDEDDDDQNDYEEEGDDLAVWDGLLKYEESKLSYQGKTSEGISFEFTSLPLHWDLDHLTQVEGSKCATDPRMRTIILEEKSLEEKCKKIQFTIRKVSEGESSTPGSVGNSEGAEKMPFKGKSTGEDDDDDDDESEKKMASPSKKGAAQEKIVVYTVFGQGDGYELYGEWKNIDISSAKESGTLSFDCRYKPFSPSATDAPAARKKEDEDEDLDEEKVDYNELIALHEDSGLPVQELRKRYRSGGNKNGPTDAKRTRSSPAAAAVTTTNDQEDDDDDDDDFDGF